MHLLRADYWELLLWQPQDHMTDLVSSLHYPFMHSCLDKLLSSVVGVPQMHLKHHVTFAPNMVTCWVSSPVCLFYVFWRFYGILKVTDEV